MVQTKTDYLLNGMQKEEVKAKFVSISDEWKKIIKEIGLILQIQ